MAKWARIENGVVRETLGFDPAGRFPADWVWVPCSDQVTCNWTYDAKTENFEAPVHVEPTPKPEIPADQIGSGLPKGATAFPPGPVLRQIEESKNVT